MKAPTHIDGVEVEAHDEPIEMKGEKWITLVPVDEDFEGIWEFSLTTGRIIKTA